MIAALALLLLAADPPKERVFGDWAVACDNVARCQAVSLQSPAQLGGDPTPLMLARDPGPAGGLTIAVAPRATPGRMTIAIDGKPVAAGVLTETGLRLAGDAAEGLARAMAGGRLLQLRDYRGRKVGTISLAGASAMLRWIDAEQGRAGGLTALVARGTRAVVLVPPAAPLPRVPALRAPKGPPPKIAPALLAALARQARCDSADQPPGAETEVARLDAHAALVLIPCGSGAYNSNSAAFVVTGGRGEPARFDDASEAAPILVNAAWDAAASTLGEFDKGRGIADCGESRKWVWDGSRFRLILATSLGECRGAAEWPTIYRATPVWR